MTREEEIEKEAYIQEELLYMDAESFIEGAKWADNHPVNVWHDANEMPRANNKNIIYQTKYCSMYNVNITFIPTCLRSCKITSSSWNEFVKEVNMKRWAYIDDILPK